ncbi:doublecortin domain-containing protein 2-like [Myripristis murdjan]|uniref:doublecortin domain-containing protein 2-like n=1 Tax=Myripristis murdjan TaxID=586833 RepID=UPI001175E9A0|nr:doublecortin domain-containing protein 2 [Myripristis murdjan]
MSSDKPNFLSQPIVKNIFMYRNGDPYYEARRIVINQKRVCNFDTLLREVTGGVQPPFGAVRNIYTPRGGHKVDCLESLQSGEQYVAAGREKFKKLDYLQIGSRKKKMMQTLPAQAKPLPQSRIIVSARFLKPLKEPCPIFVVANGDVLNPAVRLLIHQRMLGQFDRILEMITEKMGLRVLGGVRSLYTFEGHQVTDGKQLESGQFYVAVGRERFKKLPYGDLLFTKPRGTRRVNGMKASSLPPIYRFSKQNGNSKSMLRCSDSGGGDSKASPPAHSGNNKEHLSSIVREISQARLISLRKKRSGQSMSQAVSDNDDLESKADDGNTEDKTPQDQPAEEKPTSEDAKATEETDGEKAREKEEAAAESITKEDDSTSKDEKKENQEPNNESGEATAGPGSMNGGGEEEGKEEVKEDVTEESKEKVESEEQEPSNKNNTDKIQDTNEKEDGNHTPPSEDGKEEEEKNGEESEAKGEIDGEDNGKQSETEEVEEEEKSASTKDAKASEDKGEDDGRQSDNKTDDKREKEEEGKGK